MNRAMPSQPSAVFVHGFIGSFETAAYDAPHFAPDLLGYGEHREVPFERISLPAQVEHLRACLDARPELDVVDLIGHSVGGAIAMLFAATYPERVRRIVNIEGNFTLDDAFWSASVGRMTPVEAETMLAGFRADPARWLGGAIAKVTPGLAHVAECWLDAQPASTLRAMGRSVVEVTGDAVYLERLHEVVERHPVYLLAGERSRGGWNVPEWALEGCVGYEVLRDCGHLPMLEQPEAFTASLRRFLLHPDKP